MTTAERIRDLDAVSRDLDRARSALFDHLRGLEGAPRREGIAQAMTAGMGASELARGLGITRGRVYQLIEKKETR